MYCMYELPCIQYMYIYISARNRLYFSNRLSIHINRRVLFAFQVQNENGVKFLGNKVGVASCSTHLITSCD